MRCRRRRSDTAAARPVARRLPAMPKAPMGARSSSSTGSLPPDDSCSPFAAEGGARTGDSWPDAAGTVDAGAGIVVGTGASAGGSGVAVAEVGEQELWNRATVGVACVSNETAHVHQILGHVLQFVESVGDVEIEDVEVRLA